MSLPLLGAGPGSSAPPVDLLTGLVAYYRFQNSLADSSGAGRNLSGLGGDTYAVGKIGQCLSTSLGINQKTGLSLTFTDCAVSCWFNLTSDIVGVPVGFFNAFDADGFHTIIGVQAAGGTAMTITSRAFGATDVVMSGLSGGFHHVAVSISGGVVSVWRNGVLVDTGSGASGGPVTNIRASVPTNLNTLDEAALYSVALSAEQVAALYNNGSGYDPTA